MGGKDTVYVKQLYSSTLQPTEVQKQLKDIADKRFLDAPGSYGKVSREKVCRIHFYVFPLKFNILEFKSYKNEILMSDNSS